MARRLATIFVALVLLGAPTAALAQQDGNGPPVLLTADKMTYNQDLGIVVATGNVEVVQGDRVLRADSLSYNQRNDTVSASGNVSLLEPSGDVMFAEFAELTDDMRDGVVTNIRILLSDDSRMAANGARRSGGVRTEMSKAVFSPCKLCEEDPSKPPLWQIKAFEVIHDQEDHTIEYHNAFLEIAGFPVAYTPYFSHPDPTVDRKSGFLTPTAGSSSQLGQLVSTPYFWVISEDKDLTVTPTFTTKENVVLGTQYRQRLSDGELDLDGTITNPQSEDFSDVKIGGEEIRGHIDGFGRFNINDTWRWGFDAQRATDDTYLRRYRISSQRTLTSNLFVEGFRHRNYASVNAFAFQDQQDDADSGQTPLVGPEFDYSFVGEADGVGGRPNLDVNFLNLARSEGTDTRRISVKGGYELPYVGPLGDLYSFNANLQGDVYHVSEHFDPGNPAKEREGFTGRFFPQVGVDWRFPFVREAGTSSLLVEPVASVYVAPNGSNPTKIPNEDSLDVELDETTLLSANRFNGLDRVEGGKRISYGLNAAAYGAGGGFSQFFLGQSYRIDQSTDFGFGTGLSEQLSDIVGRVNLSPGRLLNAEYRFRVDTGDLNFQRSELSSSFGVRWATFGIDYLFFDQSSATGEFGDREEIFLSFRSAITDNWSLAASTRRDLDDGSSLAHTAGLVYNDECFRVSANFTRTFTSDRDVDPSDRFLVQLEFKHLGALRSSI